MKQNKYEIMKQIETLSIDDKQEIYFWLSDKVSEEMNKDFHESINKLGKLI